MISRRNLRIKVMQTLYTLASNKDEKEESMEIKDGVKMLDAKLVHSQDLFVTAVYYVTAVARYAEQDALKKAAKYLPTAEDKMISTRIAANDALWQILENATFTEAIKGSKLDRYMDTDWVTRLYKQLVILPEYQLYIAETEKSMKKERAILQVIWTHVMLRNEDFMAFLNDEMQGWEDDKEMIEVQLSNFFRKPHKANFLDLLSSEKKTYARQLLQYTIEKKEYCMELIKPRLVGWEADRVAAIDLLLLRMAICEVLFFPMIPVRVTINEYIDIAKNYSTPQSGQFTNAILDNIVKHLTANNAIAKEDFKGKA